MSFLKKVSGVLLAGCVAVSSLVPSAFGANAVSPAVSDNVYHNEYSGNWASPIESYLYQDGELLVRVETIDGQLIVEYYDASFQLVSAKTIALDAEFPLWGGFFAGETYNFVILGQENPEENDFVEVIRIMQYSKDWERLDQIGLAGVNTTEPFRAGSLRCAEGNGMLYVRTSHQMYASPNDGLNHQANMTIVLREEGMTVEDLHYLVEETAYGYVSHSFNQFVLIDESGNFVALDHGDAYPRAAVVSRTGPTVAYETSYLMEFPGEIGDNYTGACVGGLVETRAGYVAAYNYGDTNTQRDVYLSYVPKEVAQGLETHQITAYTTEMGGNHSAGNPMLVSTGMDGGYVLWRLRTLEEDVYQRSNQICYAQYNRYGEVSDITAVDGALSDCQPIVYNGKVTWYVTDDSAPVFYTLDQNGVSATRTVLELDDVSTADWYYPAVKYAYDHGLMSGTSETTFSPSVATTRGMIVTILYRLEGQPSTANANFTDVPDGQYYADAVAWASANAVVSGYGDGRFGPNDPVTREQLAAILYRYAQSKGYDVSASNGLAGFTDAASVSAYAVPAMQWANAEGVINGRTATTLAPKGNATRAETAQILMTFCESVA